MLRSHDLKGHDIRSSAQLVLDLLENELSSNGRCTSSQTAY